MSRVVSESVGGSRRLLGRALRGCAAIALGGALLAGCERTISDEGFPEFEDGVELPEEIPEPEATRDPRESEDQ